jgi:hypothetical protein
MRGFLLGMVMVLLLLSGCTGADIFADTDEVETVETVETIEIVGYVTVLNNVGDIVYECPVSKKPWWGSSVVKFDCIIDGEIFSSLTDSDILYTGEPVSSFVEE